MQKFLVIQTAFTGDVVLATCLAEKLHAFFPGACIDFLVRKGNEGLLLQHPFINRVLIWNKKSGKYKSLWQLLKVIRSERYDKVINIQRFGATGLLTAFSNARERIGFNKNPFSFLFDKKLKHLMAEENSTPHEIERNLALIEHFTDTTFYKPRLYPSPADRDAIAAYQNRPYICVAPASVWFTKQYPADKWIQFLLQLPENLSVYLLGAPGESSLCETIARADYTHSNVISLAGKLSLLQSAALMEGAVMNYTNDSAPLHFASAVNAPVTAVYCSTIPAFGYGPLSDKSYIVETTERLDCRPCGLHGHKTCPRQHFKCAYGIRENQLLAVLENT